MEQTKLAHILRLLNEAKQIIYECHDYTEILTPYNKEDKLLIDKINNMLEEIVDRKIDIIMYLLYEGYQNFNEFKRPGVGVGHID